MPLFAGALFAWIASFFAQPLKKIAFRVALIAAFVIASGVSVAILIAGTIGILNGISTSVPATVNQVWGWVMPWNAGACLVAIVSMRFLRAIHDYHLRILSLKASSTI